MAVLAVFLLLALAGARACEEQQQGTPGAPTPTSTPAAAAAAAAATTTTTTTTTTTEEPPTTESFADVLPIPPQSSEERIRQTEPSLYIYALLNAARLRGRTIFHKIEEECEDEDSEGCSCAEKLFDDAICYEQYGAVERWCILAPEYRGDFRPDGDRADFLSYQEDNSVSQVAGEQSTVYDQLKCTEPMPSVSLIESPTVTQLFSSREAQAIPVQSSSRPVSSVICEPEPQDLSLRKSTSQSVMEQWVDDMEIMHPPRPLSPISDIEPKDSVCEGNDQTMNSVYQEHNYHSVWTEREMEAAHSLASMLTSEVTIQVVNQQSDHEPVPMDEISDVPDEPVEDNGGTSDGSLVVVGSVGSNVARVGTSSSESEDVQVVNITPGESMDVDTDNTGPDAMEVDIEEEVESSVPDIPAAVEVRTPVEQMEEAVTGRWEGERTVEQASRLQLPVPTPEPRPGPSGVWRPPSQSSPSPSPPPPPNVSLPDYPGTRYSRRRESLLYSARGYPGSEMLGPVSPLEWVPQPPADIKKELNRIFGVQEDEPPSLEQPEQYNCPGELKVAMLGTNVLPMFTVYVECDKDPKHCQLPTVCSPVVSSIPVSKRKNVPFEKQVFTLIGDPYDEWEPGILRLSTACFCAPPNYTPRAMHILNVPASP